MKEILYIEVPTPNTAAVRAWLQEEFQPLAGRNLATPDGIRIEGLNAKASGSPEAETANPKRQRLAARTLPAALSVIVWSIQRTTYLKAFSWSQRPTQAEGECAQHLLRAVRQEFPPRYPDLPTIDLANQTIFEALTPFYPKTVQYFQRMPNGAVDLERVYVWEKRWRDSVQPSQTPKPVIFQQGRSDRLPTDQPVQPYPGAPYDLVVLGGALGAIQAALMAQRGHRVLLIERLPFERMHRAWNIAQADLQTLVDLELFTLEELTAVVGQQYLNGFNKFFDANVPNNCQAPVLHTPTALDVAVDSEALLKHCGDRLLAAGSRIQDRTEFLWATIDDSGVDICIRPEGSEHPLQVRSRFLVDAMGTGSPIEWQLNGGRAFDNVCPSVGACISGGFPPGSWDGRYGDFLSTCGDISRGRQLIWKLLPGSDNDLTVYLFHYHELHPDSPGSLLDLYEDFFHILPEYRRCKLDKLTWRKPTFGYIPGHYKAKQQRQVRFDRLITLGDAATLQSPLIFSGFGNLVRRLPGLSDLIDTALRHDLWRYRQLIHIRRFQSSLTVTWLLSKAMMIPTWQPSEPSQVNTVLNAIFRVLSQEETPVAERFIKDRSTWPEFNRIVFKAAYQNPQLLTWLWETAGTRDVVRWLFTYLSFTMQSLLGWLFGWFPGWLRSIGGWLEPLLPSLYFRLLAWAYRLEIDHTNPPPVPRLTVTISRQPPPVAAPRAEADRS